LTGNLYNTYHWGGYIIWESYPERRVFIDGRADMYGDQFMEQYHNVSRAGPAWRQPLEEHGVRMALVEKESPMATILLASGGWREVMRGKTELVLLSSER